MIKSSSRAQSPTRRRRVYRASAGDAVLVMILFTGAQLRLHEPQRLLTASFLGILLLVGFFAFRSGLAIAYAFERLTRPMPPRGRKS